jgi:hypothetical protein
MILFIGKILIFKCFNSKMNNAIQKKRNIFSFDSIIKLNKFF